MTLSLSLEWSTRRLSAALAKDGMPVAETARNVDRFHAPTALAMVQTLLRDAETGLDRVDEILVGRGPGNYSGVRQAFAWAAGAAAPGGVRVKAVSSARAMGERWLRDGNSEPLAVMGDARRGFWWGSWFTPGTEPTWEIHPPEIWLGKLGGSTVVSSEPERIPGILTLVEDHPSAMDLVRVADSEPCEPLYLHPPV